MGLSERRKLYSKIISALPEVNTLVESIINDCKESADRLDDAFVNSIHDLGDKSGEWEKILEVLREAEDLILGLEP